MALDRDDRTLLGLVIAPLATVPILSGTLAASFLGEMSLPAMIDGAQHSSFFFALFGLPVAYAVEAILVILLRSTGRSPRTVSGVAVVSVGTLTGALVFGIIGLGALGAWLPAAATGAAMGGGASTLFVLIRGRKPSSGEAAVARIDAGLNSTLRGGGRF